MAEMRRGGDTGGGGGKGQRVLRERKPEIRELSDGSDDEERMKNNRRSSEAYSRYIRVHTYIFICRHVCVRVHTF